MDRRWLYLIFLVTIILPWFWPVNFEVGVNSESRLIYDYINNLPKGSLAWLSIDYGAASAFELTPMVEALLTHLFSRGVKVVIFSTSEQGPLLVEEVVRQVAARFQTSYGSEWVNIGYKPGGIFLLRAMTKDIWGATAGRDMYGNRFSDLPLMNNLKRLTKEQVQLIVVFSAGDSASSYLTYVKEPEGVPLAVGVTPILAPAAMPFVRSGQYLGILAGLRGAAEYETLVGLKGPALRAMASQSLAHLVIIGAVLIGNLELWLSRVRKAG